MSTKILEEFFSCPICIEILNNPITTVCGHNYCKSCVSTNLNTCPICKKSVNFANSNINFQLKNVIESIKNLDNDELKSKFFPEIKEEENKKIQELKILVSNIFGQNFLCENCQCKEIIKNLVIKILSNDKQSLFNLVDHVNGKLYFPNKDKQLNYKDNNGNNKGEASCLSFFSINNPFKTLRKEHKKKPKLRTDNKENYSSNFEKMEYEVSIDKYLNNSNRGKNIFFNIGEGNTENVFRVKRLHCELMDKLNKSSGDKLFKNNCLNKTNNENKTNENIKNILQNNLANNSQKVYNNYYQSNNTMINRQDKTARKIQFDSYEVDKNLNIILKDFSKKDMLLYNNAENSNCFGDSETNNTFSTLISNNFYSQNMHTNPHLNINSNQGLNCNYKSLNLNLVHPLFNQFAYFNSNTHFHQSLRINNDYNQTEVKGDDQNRIQEDCTTEYQTKRRKL